MQLGGPDMLRNPLPDNTIYWRRCLYRHAAHWQMRQATAEIEVSDGKQMVQAFGEITTAVVDPESSLTQQFILVFLGFSQCECPSPIIAPH